MPEVRYTLSKMTCPDDACEHRDTLWTEWCSECHKIIYEEIWEHKQSVNTDAPPSSLTEKGSADETGNVVSSNHEGEVGGQQTESRNKDDKVECQLYGHDYRSGFCQGCGKPEVQEHEV